MLNWNNLCMNECKKNTMTIANPYLRKAEVCTLIQCFLQSYFQIFIQNNLKKFPILFLDHQYLVLVA